MSSEETGRLNFRIRPSPVLVDHRPLYKISQVLLVLELSSRGGKSTLPRLQLFSWAMKKAERQQVLQDAADTSNLSVQAWGFDPALVIALKFACAEKLVSPVSTGYQITESGTAFVRDIANDVEVFFHEKAFLKKIGKKITETMVEVVVESWKEK